MKQTAKYQLNLIESGDSFLPTPINENTQALEDTLGGHFDNTNNPHCVTAAQVGAATSTHTHTAANITAGVIPVTRGGTGHATIDTTPKVSSTKMVTSGGVYAALKEKYGTSNPPWVIGTYTGDGTIGVAKAISVGFQPTAVFVVAATADHTSFGAALRADSITGSISTLGILSGGGLGFGSELTITSSGFTVIRSDDVRPRCLNEANVVYIYLALK